MQELIKDLTIVYAACTSAELPLPVIKILSRVIDQLQEQALQQTPCTTPSELLLQMYNEGRELAKDGFETWQDRDIHSANENALLRVMRLIKKRQQMA